jgi:hypothetical protein
VKSITTTPGCCVHVLLPTAPLHVGNRNRGGGLRVGARESKPKPKPPAALATACVESCVWFDLAFSFAQLARGCKESTRCVCVGVYISEGLLVKVKNIVYPNALYRALAERVSIPTPLARSYTVTASRFAGGAGVGRGRPARRARHIKHSCGELLCFYKV